MTAAELKDFEKLLKVCRKQGITKLTFGHYHVEFGDLPNKASEDSDEIQTDELTPDELIFYAAEQGLR